MINQTQSPNDCMVNLYNGSFNKVSTDIKTFNYSESSDTLSNSSQSPRMLNAYEQINLPEYIANYENKNSYFYTDDQEMSDEDDIESYEFGMGKSLPISNFDSNTYTPQVNRGGRKQVKVGTTKRNARERNRVRYINHCFEILREHIPVELASENKNRKLSKVETLKFAALYIQQLTDLLRSTEETTTQYATHFAPLKNECSQSLCKRMSKKNKQKLIDNKDLKNLIVNKIESNTKNICFNNININIYENRVETDVYSPASSTSSSTSSSSSSSANSYYNCNYYSYPDNLPVSNTTQQIDNTIYNCGKSLMIMSSNIDQYNYNQNNWNQNYNKW